MKEKIIGKTKKTHKLFLAIILLLIAVIIGLLMGRELEKRAYRLAYPELISEYSMEYTLDPYFVAAVIHVESGNRPSAVSPSGAIGLMQIMPKTGAWIAEKIKIENYTQQQLYDPETSIRFGCWYLRFLLNRYDNNMPPAVAAYNAGQGKVDEWLQDKTVYDGEEFILIPYPETENYLKKVKHAYEKYQMLYKDRF